MTKETEACVVTFFADDASSEVREVTINPEHARLLDFPGIAARWASKHADHPEGEAIKRWAVKTSGYFLVGHTHGVDPISTEADVVEWLDEMFPQIGDFRNGRSIPWNKERDGEIN